MVVGDNTNDGNKTTQTTSPVFLKESSRRCRDRRGKTGGLSDWSVVVLSETKHGTICHTCPAHAHADAWQAGREDSFRRTIKKEETDSLKLIAWSGRLHQRISVFLEKLCNAR
ncbi:hypothetical protein [Xanthocytophaga agilis]|uniref:Uncharacterized protein n=1 Tax=Xanthocytophaga agilis TaxID=3048010 RepID=A0AAE3R5C2_9BACT|nr:hypothetical protein [Xanthocytophaga agilis]MDJ1501724.1 hypothetical protein [Xanthocytophaga agilis]